MGIDIDVIRYNEQRDTLLQWLPYSTQSAIKDANYPEAQAFSALIERLTNEQDKERTELENHPDLKDVIGRRWSNLWDEYSVLGTNVMVPPEFTTPFTCRIYAKKFAELDRLNGPKARMWIAKFLNYCADNNLALLPS